MELQPTKGLGDKPEWIWSNSKEFTVSACYKILNSSGQVHPKTKKVWNTKVPLAGSKGSYSKMGQTPDKVLARARPLLLLFV